MNTNGNHVHLVQGTAALLFLLLIFTVFLPLKREIDRRLLVLKEEITLLFEQKTGRRISIGAVSPSILRDVELRDLVLYGRENERDVLLRISTTKVHYDLFTLLTKGFVSSLREISLENSRFSMNWETDTDLAGFLRNLFSGTGEESPEMPVIRISGRNLTVLLEFPQGEISLENLSFKLDPRESRYAVDLRSVVSAELNGSTLPVSSAVASISFSGEVVNDFSTADAVLKLGSFSTELFTVSPQTLQLSLDGSSVRVRKIQDRNPVDLDLAFDWKTGTLNLAFIGESFSPDSLVSLKGDLSRYSSMMSTRLSGRGKAEYRPGFLELLYQGELTAAQVKTGYPGLAPVSGRLNGSIGYSSETRKITSEGLYEAALAESPGLRLPPVTGTMNGRFEYSLDTGRFASEGELRAAAVSTFYPWMTSASGMMNGRVEYSTVDGTAYGEGYIRGEVSDSAYPWLTSSSGSILGKLEYSPADGMVVGDGEIVAVIANPKDHQLPFLSGMMEGKVRYSTVSGSLVADGDVTAVLADPEDHQLPFLSGKMSGRVEYSASAGLISGEGDFVADLADPESHRTPFLSGRMTGRAEYALVTGIAVCEGDFTADLAEPETNRLPFLSGRLSGKIEYSSSTGTIAGSGDLSAVLVNPDTPHVPVVTGTADGRAAFGLLTKKFTYDGKFQADCTDPRYPWLHSVAGKLEGNDESLNAESLSAITEYGRFGFNGSLSLKDYLPEGVFSIEQGTFQGFGPVTASVSTKKLKKDTLQLASDAIALGSFRTGTATAVLTYVNRVIGFTTDLVIPGKEKTGVISAEGTVSTGENVFLEIFTRISGLQIADGKRFLDAAMKDFSGAVIPDFLSSFMLEADVSLMTDFRKYSLTAPVFSVRDGKGGKSGFSGEIALNNTAAVVRNAVIDWAGLHAEGSVTANISDLEEIGLTSTLTVERVPVRLSGTFIPGKRLSLEGDYDSQLTLTQDASGSLEFLFRTTGMPVHLQESHPLVSARLSGTYRAADSWDVSIASLEVKRLPFLPDQGVIALTGLLRPNSGVIQSVSFTDAFSTVKGSGEIQLGFPGFSRMEGRVTLAGGNGMESYDLDFTYAEELFAGRLRFTKTPLERLGFSILRGRASGALDFSGKLPFPEVSLELTLEDALFNNEKVDGSLALEASRKTLVLNSLDARYKLNRLRTNSVRIDLETGEVRGEFLYDRNLPGRPIRAVAALTGKLSDPVRLLSSPEDLINQDLEAVLSLSEISVGFTPMKPWKVAAKIRSKRLTVNGGPENAFAGYIDFPGNFELLAKGDIPFSFYASGKFDGSTIDAEVSNLSINVEDINRILRILAFRFTKGRLNGNLSIRGSVQDPDISGTLAIMDAGAQLDLTPDAIGPLNGSLTFHDRTVTISKMRTHIGETPVFLEAQSSLDHWLPSPFRLVVSTEGERGVHIVYDFSQVMVDGYGRGTVIIDGDLTRASITGNFTVSNCVVALNTRPVEIPIVPWEYGLTVNLDVRSGKQVSFIWPVNLPILTAYADLGQQMHIYFDSESEKVSVDGTASIKGGEIFYFDRSFYLREGSIIFSGNQDPYDPRLTARAEIRETIDNETVKIYLVADESRLSQFTPRFESDPVKSNDRILSALGYGIYSPLVNRDFSESLSETLLLGLDMGSYFGFMRTFESNVRKTLNLDLFSVRTSMVQNILREKIFTPEEDLLDNSSVLGKYLDNTTLLFGKYIGNDLFLESMLQIKANDLIMNSRGAKIDWELSLEWKTPFFLLDWSFQPKRESLDTLFLSDNTFSFSWKYSF